MFTDFEATVYYRDPDSSDTTPPLIRTAEGVTDGTIAFFEVERGGLAVVGDDALLDGVRFGCVAGYDMTHMPNHMNVLVRSESLERPPIRVGSNIVFSRPR